MIDRKYLDSLQYILDNGEERDDRTGTGTISVFDLPNIKVDLSEGFPLLTTKKVGLKAIIHELLWFIKGDTNIKYLNDNGVKIWDAWADENGDLGRIYGAQWRGWNGASGVVDQLQKAIDTIRTNPKSRRIIVNAWNAGELDQMALTPCHAMFQFYCHEDGGLSIKLYQRSADFPVGVPFNIASYALLLMMVAKITGRTAKYCIFSYGDAHIYKNQVEGVMEQLSRSPLDPCWMSIYGDQKEIEDFKFEDFDIVGYEAHPFIKYPVSV